IIVCHKVGRKECEEETLQTAFKKLRVDAERYDASCDSEIISRACHDSNGAKPKVVSQKDNWHGSTRKTSRGASRTQRRRRSKSPILQPPKFTYCSTATPSALSPPCGCLKHQRLVPLEPSECPTVERKTLSTAAHKDPLSSCAQSHITALVFGTSDAYGTPLGATVSSLPGTISLDTAEGKEDTSLPEPQCCCQPNPTSWNNVEVYSFTGLRNVISECENATQGPEGTPRTVSTNSNISTGSLSSGSVRSCSEQARAYVDDITIEDLSGYLEYYLYIPKKMSHMAEMMYT
uniref:Oxidative stress-responsive serine-rich protein 1 n=1 Tax=Neogobius melanostomus TaxID=47308 RepID=A0A8C6WWR4_9GOBI